MVQEKSALKITEFGNPILRAKAKKLTVSEIKNVKTKKLILEMEKFLVSKKLGVGLAAPQVGIGQQIAIIRIRSSKHRPEAENYNLDIINPEIIECFGRKQQMWEGCISAGSAKASLFAKASRYKNLKLKYTDINGKIKTDEFEGIIAQIIQHEVDHLNGILFVDRVKNTKTFITYNEYLKLAEKSTNNVLKNKKTSKVQ